MKKLIPIFLLVILILSITTCSQTNEPKPPEYKDPREMTWTADTLKVEEDWVIQILPEAMHVITPDDIWLSTWVGHAQMWHYNGEAWEMKQDIGGAINSIVEREVGDLWAGGRTGDLFLLAHYNGDTWDTYRMQNTIELYHTYSPKNMQGEVLEMCLDDQNNLWACGRKGIVFKYDGIEWEADTVRIDNYSIDKYFLKSIAYHNGEIHMLASMLEPDIFKETYFHIHGQMNNWIVADSNVISNPYSPIKWGWFGLNNDESDILYSYGIGGIWQYTNESWAIDFDMDSRIRIFHSTNDYKLAAGDSQGFYYRDGVNWNGINEILNITDPHFNFTVLWTNGQEIFVGGYTFEGWPQRGIIWHGE